MNAALLWHGEKFRLRGKNAEIALTRLKNAKIDLYNVKKTENLLLEDMEKYARLQGVSYKANRREKFLQFIRKRGIIKQSVAVTKRYRSARRASFRG